MGLYVLSAGARTRRSIVLGVGALQVKVVPASGSRVRQCICVICVWWPGGLVALLYVVRAAGPPFLHVVCVVCAGM